MVTQFLPCIRLRRLLKPIPELPSPLGALDVTYYKILDKFVKLCARVEVERAE